MAMAVGRRLRTFGRCGLIKIIYMKILRFGEPARGQPITLQNHHKRFRGLFVDMRALLAARQNATPLILGGAGTFKSQPLREGLSSIFACSVAETIDPVLGRVPEKWEPSMVGLSFFRDVADRNDPHRGGLKCGGSFC
jgi:hypothetical protein